MRPNLLDEFIEASNAALSVDELFAIYKRAMEEIGFDRLIFSLMTEHVAIRRPAGHGVVANYPSDWMKYYLEKKFEKADPVRQKMYSSAGVFIWKDISKEHFLTKTQLACLNLGAESGLYDGIGIPMRGPHGAIAGIGAASSSGGVELDKRNLSYANLISHQFYTVFLSLEAKHEEVTPVFLSDREREVLYWCGQGKTRSEISDIVYLSESTVNFHIQNILKKLDASNVTLAVLKGILRGLIQQ